MKEDRERLEIELKEKITLIQVNIFHSILNPFLQEQEEKIKKLISKPKTLSIALRDTNNSKSH
jgi:hypothetical protein